VSRFSSRTKHSRVTSRYDFWSRRLNLNMSWMTASDRMHSVACSIEYVFGSQRGRSIGEERLRHGKAQRSSLTHSRGALPIQPAASQHHISRVAASSRPLDVDILSATSAYIGIGKPLQTAALQRHWDWLCRICESVTDVVATGRLSCARTKACSIVESYA
jgi:hypothetical protein